MIQILHIEDQLDHFELARLAVARLPIMSYERAENVEEAVACLRLIKYDLVLVDLDLDDSAGLDTIDRVKGEHPESIIIVLSNRDPEEYGMRSIHAGADDFVPKAELANNSLPRIIRHAFARRDKLANRPFATL